ncbi:MAG: leucine-rich repeat domain-containing protein, partial [Clostridiales bacterium]|nr:leucine-rich repeat domain-containing protein [Clostridiales bacterium]
MKKVFLTIAMLAMGCALAAGIASVPVETVKADGDVAINETNFPDEHFRSWIKENIGNGDDVLSPEEILNTTKIDVALEEIKDLTGIEYFTSLTYLECSYNDLTDLDVSKNKALEVLSCETCTLTHLDVRECTSLKFLSCADNNITGLDVSRNRQLDRLYCNINMISKLFLPKESSAFTNFHCDNGVEVIVVKDGEIVIDDINFPDANFRSWIKAHIDNGDDVLSQTEIANTQEIGVYGQSISNLKGIEYFTSLTVLDCYYNQLTSLDVSQNTALTDLRCNGNQLTSLDVSQNTALTSLDCSFNQLTSLDMSKNTLLTYLNCNDNGSITSLDVSKNTALTDLRCNGNQLTSLDVSQNTALTSLDCSYNQLTSLDMSKNTLLTYLSCSENHSLTSLDVSQNTALTSLECGSNQLTSLDVSNNTALTYLYCSFNQLTSLDVSKNTLLTYLSCSENHSLTSLDVSKNTKLITLSCFKTELKSLDISQNPDLLETYIDGEKTELQSDDIYVWSYSRDIGPHPDPYWADMGFRSYSGLVINKDLEVITVRKEPTATPTATTVPAKEPTKAPTTAPSKEPTKAPTVVPAKDPTKAPTTAPANASINLDKKTASLKCGDKLTLKATLKGSTGKVTWKSSDTKIATVDSNGKITTKQAGTVTITASAGKVKAACTVTVLYKDVTNTKDFWYAPTNYLTAAGVVKGYDKQTKFKPANDCTRAQMVTFLYRLQGEPKTKSTTCKFNDVKKTDYFFKPVIWAVEKGITTGVSKTKFNPQGVCTRAQTVTFLWRMANKPAPKAKSCKFSDVKKKDYFYNPVIWA